MKSRPAQARKWRVIGRVQGVGFRWFVVKCAEQIGVTGWVRNEANGDVTAYAAGSEDQLNQLAGFLHQGPPLSIVRTVQEQEAALESHTGFSIR